MREVIVCFGPDTHSEQGMRFNVLATTGERLKGVRTIQNRATLRKMLVYLGATAEQLADFDQQCISWGQGSVHAQLLPDREDLPRIHRMRV